MKALFLKLYSRDVFSLISKNSFDTETLMKNSVYKYVVCTLSLKKLEYTLASIKYNNYPLIQYFLTNYGEFFETFIKNSIGDKLTRRIICYFMYKLGEQKREKYYNRIHFQYQSNPMHLYRPDPMNLYRPDPDGPYYPGPLGGGNGGNNGIIGGRYDLDPFHRHFDNNRGRKFKIRYS